MGPLSREPNKDSAGVRHTCRRVLMARTADGELSAELGGKAASSHTHRCICNSVNQMLWGPLAAPGKDCPWRPFIAETLAKFGLR